MDVKEEDHIAIGLFKDNDDNVLIRSRKSGFDFDIRTGKMKENMDGFKENLNGKNLELYSDLQKINIKYTYTPADTYPVFTTKQNEAIILKSEALLGNSVYVETKLEKYYNSIKMATALALPVNSNYDYKVPHKFVYYSKAGDAYQLVLKKDTADIYKLAFSTKDRTNIDVKLISEINPKDISTNEEVSIADVDGYTAYANTSPMINYSWTFNASTMKTPYIPNYTQSPDHLENLSGTSSQTGIPYCWGGAHGDVSACGWDSYSTALSKGKTAGNIRYENEEWVNSTAGVDCSGFISVAYRLGYKYNTTGLYYYFTVGTWNNLSSGCIFDKPGDHVVMYDYPYFSGSTIIGYYTRESTTSGSQDKAKLYSRSLSELSGYYVLHK